MNKNERTLDFHIGNLLTSAEIQFTPNASNIAEIHEALKTSSKKGTGRVGFPEFTAKSGDFILVVEDKADLNKQAHYTDESETELALDTKSITDFAENGALHYAKEIVAKTNFKKVFAFECTGDEKHHIIRPIFVGKGGITKSEYDKYYLQTRNKIADTDARLKLLQDTEDNYYLTVDHVLNLANRAKNIFESSEMEEKHQLIKMTLQNLRLNGSLVQYDYLNPFDEIVKYADRSAWLHTVDDVRTNIERQNAYIYIPDLRGYA